MAKIVYIFLLGFLWHSNQAQTAFEIIKKADEKLRGKTSKSEMTIKVIRPTWEREMTMKSWSKGTEMSMVLITSPAKDAGTVFLKREKEIYNWMPSIERSIKLPPSMMMQSWMGTDFTNDDLVKESSAVEDYTHKILKDSTIEGRVCWKIELTPKPDAPVVWGKIYSWVDKKDFLQLRIEFYDEDGFLINTMIGSDIKTLGGKIVPSKMEMIPAEKKGNKTVMIYNSLLFDQEINDDFFSSQNMQRVK
jgi:outer membrane lipoprotein-sorting protein